MAIDGATANPSALAEASASAEATADEPAVKGVGGAGGVSTRASGGVDTVRQAYAVWGVVTRTTAGLMRRAVRTGAGCCRGEPSRNR